MLTHFKSAVTSKPESRLSVARVIRKARSKLITEQVKKEACRSPDIGKGEGRERKGNSAL
jgi:hypothetical protein